MTATDFATAKEVAHTHCVSERTARRWAARGILGGYKLGGQYRFPKSALGQNGQNGQNATLPASKTAMAR